jgi:hypothetical protein
LLKDVEYCHLVEFYRGIVNAPSGNIRALGRIRKPRLSGAENHDLAYWWANVSREIRRQISNLGLDFADLMR